MSRVEPDAAAVDCPICGIAMAESFRTEEARYFGCPGCDLLKPCTDDLDALDVNVSIYHEQFDENLDTASVLSRKRRRKYDSLLVRLEDRKRTGNLLDIGCGAGRFLRCAAERGWNAFGCDPAMTRAASESRADSRVRIFDKTLDACGFEDAMFDVVYANEVVEHIDDLQPLIGEIARVLRPGGVAVFRTPHHRSWTRRCVGTSWRHFGVLDKGHVTFLTPGAFSRLFEANGMRLTKVETQDFSLRDRFRPSVKLLRSAFGRVYACVGLIARVVNRGERLTVWGERV